MKILITNDDGIHAPGVHILAEMAKKFGDVVAVVPDGPRSAQSMALTVNTPIFAKPLHTDDGIEWWEVSGTPADCVKIAASQLVEHKPDVIISGINHGSNASVNVLYSGTVGAALEGTMHDVPSIAFSICDHSFDVDMQFCLPYFEKVLGGVLKYGLPNGVCINVNAPVGLIKGIRVCRQAFGRWANEFTKDNAPRPWNYYWMVGDFFNTENDEAGDSASLEKGYVTIVPVQVDMTSYSTLEHCKKFL